MKRLLAIFTVCLLMTGCVGIVGAEGVSVMATDKTVVDHVISLSSGKNCSTIRKDLGMTYCEEDEVGVQDEVYCYRTLGRVNCFAVPAPHGESQPTVGHIPASAPPPR